MTKVRWRSMKIVPKRAGSLWIRGDNGKVYAGFYQAGSLFTQAPGYVTYTGWRRTEPPKENTEDQAKPSPGPDGYAARILD